MDPQQARTREAFVREIGKELEEGNVAIFAGAGLSTPAGYAGWKDLLRPLAEELGLSVDKEHDLVGLAQYHINMNGLNRSQINKLLIEEFAKAAFPTENHQILARLPITTYWTTNYDKLIEKSLEQGGKKPDVKYTKQQLAITKPKRGAIVYKMHGDIDHPDEAILARDDYENYHKDMAPFISALSGDLVSKTFIFIGISFSDPNLDYILSRVRVAYQKSPRKHYCFFKVVSKGEHESEADFEYRHRKQQLFCEDLKRFNITSILVDSYDEITHVLRIIESNHRKKSVFISGAAHEFGTFGSTLSLRFIHNLSQGLIRSGYRIVSGFGLGVGNAVISGALEEIYMNPARSDPDQLTLRPFPQEVYGPTGRKEVWRRYREDMISHAGVSIFLFGNKESEDKVVLSNGMREEFEISKANGNILIPIGATGYMAQAFWEELMESLPDNWKSSSNVVDLFTSLGDPSINLDSHLTAVLNLIKTTTP